MWLLLQVSRVKTFYTIFHEMRIQNNGMFAKMTPDTLDRPDSDTSRRLGNLDLAKFRERRARTLGGDHPGISVDHSPPASRGAVPRGTAAMEDYCARPPRAVGASRQPLRGSRIT